MKKLPPSLQLKLQQRKENLLYRKLNQEPYTGIDFYSNDYLGFSKQNLISLKAEEILQEYNITQHGSTGSRLISGNHKLFQITEKYLANYHHTESALLFNSGYDANLGVLSCITQRGDVILYDEFSHASIRDGIQLSQAKSYKFSHNNLDDLASKIEKYSSQFQNIYVVTESIFSMDGDSPNLKKLVEICNKENVFLIIDEAHALGVVGKKGEGLVQHLGLANNVFIRIVTFGKALGCHGAAVLANKDVKKYLTNFAKSFIYTTSLPPHAVAIILASYKFLKESDQKQKLQKNITYFTSHVNQLQLQDQFVKSQTPIQSFLIKGNKNTLSLSKLLKEKEIIAKAILSPTVKLGEERIRICLHSFNTFNQIDHLLNIIHKNR